MYLGWFRYFDEELQDQWNSRLTNEWFMTSSIREFACEESVRNFESWLELENSKVGLLVSDL